MSDRTMKLALLECHRQCLAHDLLWMERLYEYLWQRLSRPAATMVADDRLTTDARNLLAS